MPLTFEEKVKIVRESTTRSSQESSKELCLQDAEKLQVADPVRADWWLEKAAQYAWGYWRPEDWKRIDEQ